MSPETQALHLLKSLDVKQPPVDVGGLARKLRVRIEQADLGDECSGVLVRRGSAAVIGVHFAHHPNRQRFTVAHELGHFLLHKGGTYVDKGTSLRFRNSESGSGTQKEEREANQFAAALLMPSEWVRAEFERNPFDLADDSQLQQLCQTFGVSAQAMSYRLTNLGLLQ
jgi:predicted transcriptional regulator